MTIWNLHLQELQGFEAPSAPSMPGYILTWQSLTVTCVVRADGGSIAVLPGYIVCQTLMRA